jgi:hypothetical protein
MNFSPASVVVLVSMVAACSGSSLQASSGTPCSSDADCGQQSLCGFSLADTCTSKGQCFSNPGSIARCSTFAAGCACDGSSVNLTCNGLPAGFASKPVAYNGSCVDSGTGDGGKGCVADGDCGSDKICGFKVLDACSATGQCFADGGESCSGPPPQGCSCNGRSVNLACNGLPSGYAPAPVLHSGVCADAGATDGGTDGAPTDGATDGPSTDVSTDDAPMDGSPTDGGTDGAQPDTSGGCREDTDCGMDQICGFSANDACAAQGQCFDRGSTCGGHVPACGCDGSSVNMICNGLPMGYVPAPVAHIGACTDGGTADAGRPCTSDMDCRFTQICGFPLADRCSAEGQCFARSSTCGDFFPGCACDGTTINMICNGLPDGYMPAPVDHGAECGAGSCTSDSDCADNGICGFKVDDGCLAQGECFPPPTIVCGGYSPGCGCDFSSVNLICNGLPTGYAPKPVVFSGECPF